MKDLGLNLRPVGRRSEPSAAAELEAGFGECRGNADFNRCTERLGGGEPATTLGVDADTSRDVDFPDDTSGASLCSGLPNVACPSLSSLATASLGEGALKAPTGSCSRVACGLFRVDCLARGLILGGILEDEVHQNS